MSRYRRIEDGHDWHPDTDVGTDPDPDTDIDIFRFEVGTCNGPECRRCGWTGCHHCNRSVYNEKCPPLAAPGSNVAP